jgi:hypothetical protein
MKRQKILKTFMVISLCLFNLASVPHVQATAPSLLTLSDLQWQGYYRTPDGDSVGGVGGSSSYAPGAITIRYVNGQRRFLIPNFAYGPKGEFWGDLVEYAAPTSGLYTGSDAIGAASLVPIRRWAAPDWTSLYANTPEWANNSNLEQGARLGTIYWDETRQVLWYQIYGYYTRVNEPFLAAVQLLDTADTVHGGSYKQVGANYGPWYYSSNDPAAMAYWKQVNFFMMPVPTSAQADLGGRKVIIGGATGSVVEIGNLGPGMYAIGDWPSLSDPPKSVIPTGLSIADYSALAGVHPYSARRNNNYTPLDNVSCCFPVGGYWLGSLDRVVGMTWIETATKQGVLMIGAQASGRVSYGHNPISISPQGLQSLTHNGTTATGTFPYPHPLTVGTTIRIINATPPTYNGTFAVTSVPTATTFTYTLPLDPGANAAGEIYLYGWDTSKVPDLIDPSRGNPEAANGYLAEFWHGQTYVFDPAQIRQVGLGQRAGNNTGINPTELGDWHTKWPNLPYDQQVGQALQTRLVSSNEANRLVWDPIAQQLIYAVPQSVSVSNPRLTLNFFNITSDAFTPLVGDINLDHIVNSIDYSILNSHWFTADSTSDLNHDSIVNAIDFSLLNANWFKTW